MKKPVFHGVIPPVVTVFDKNGRLDIKGNCMQADFLIGHGVDGLAYLGTTGEFGALTLEEKCDFLWQMTEYVSGRVKVLAGVSDTCLENVLFLIRHCERIGVNGILLLPPYFSVYSSEMLAAYFSYIASSTELPVILYNFPALTGFDMEAGWVKELALKHQNIAGIKETVTDVLHIREMLKIKKERPDFAVFAAYDDQFLDVIREPCVDGFIHASGNFAPEPAAVLCQAAQNGNEDLMRSAFRRVLTGMKVYSLSQPLFLAVKEAVYQRVLGYEGGERLPALPLSAKQKKEVKTILSELEKG